MKYFRYSGGTSGEGTKLYKAFNRDKNEYLEDMEFYAAVKEIGYYEAWNRDGEPSLDEKEWRFSLSEYLGGYRID